MNEKIKRDEKKNIAIDFDGVIHHHITPFERAELVPDGPVPGAFEFIKTCIREGFDVVIFSARANDIAGARAIREWFEDYGEPELADILHVTANKPNAVLYIDDKGYHFKGEFPSMEFLRSFRPWNR